MASPVESLPITVGVGAFIVRDDRLLVVRKTYGPSKGLWTIPSGYVELRETVVQTLEREVLEETGIVAKTEILVGVRNRVTETANDTFLIFTMAYVSGEPVPDGVEVNEARFEPLLSLATADDSAPFTQAIVGKVSTARGFRLDAYVPPPGTLDSLAYLLFV